MRFSPDQISVGICAYTDQRWEVLITAIESVGNQSQLPKELLVIIDHNQPLYHRLLEYRHRWSSQLTVRVAENTGKQGLSGGRNTIINLASGALIAFLDDDAVAAPDWLERLVACFEDDRVFGATGAILPQWPGKAPAWLPEEFYWVVGCSYHGLPERRQSVRNAIGANMMITRSAFEIAGGFREEMGRLGNIPLGNEETEFCIRARQFMAGGQILFEPRAVVHHVIPSNRVRWAYFSARCYYEGISKAATSGFVGARDGLSAERLYTTRVLPLAVLRNVWRGATHWGDGGLRRAFAIVFGLLRTTHGYIVGRVQSRLRETA